MGGRHSYGSKIDPNEASKREPENTMVVPRRAAGVGERGANYSSKVNLSPNDKANSSKAAITTLVVMGWASNKWKNEGKKDENSVTGNGHGILLFREVDSQNENYSGIMNGHNCVDLDNTQFRSAEKKNVDMQRLDGDLERKR